MIPRRLTSPDDFSIEVYTMTTTNNTTAIVFVAAFEKLATSYKKLSVLSARSDTQETRLKLLEGALSTASAEAVSNGFDAQTALVVEQVSLARSRVGNFDALVSKCGILRDEHDVKAFFARLNDSLVTSLTVEERVKEATGEIISILWTFAKDSSAQLWVVASNGALWLWDKAVDLFHWIVTKIKEMLDARKA